MASARSSAGIVDRGRHRYYTARKAAFVGVLLAQARRERGLEPVEYWVLGTNDLTVRPGREE